MVTVIDHPLIRQKLTYLRDKQTRPHEFRTLLSETTALMMYEITRDLPTVKVEIETPLEKTWSHVLADQVVLLPILRAGLGMLDGALSMIPNARVGHVGLYRNEKTLEPVQYYVKFPTELTNGLGFVLDPMLATGGSSSTALALIKQRKPKALRYLCLVSAPEGIRKVEADHPDVPIYTASIDRELNDIGYILPGLGDAGDRLYGTK